MKKTFCSFLAAVLCFSLLSCAQKPAEEITAPSPESTVASTEAPVQHLSFAELQYTEFLFSSGAGAWGTTLYVSSDGTFRGSYHDSEMGSNSEEYPMGTVYLCEFTGQFGEPVPIDEYTWSLPIRVLSYAQVPERQEIEDGIRYCYTTAFGLEGTRAMLLFSPDTPIHTLPEEYCQWIGISGSGTLSFWGLYNPDQQQGFSSTDLKQYVMTAIDQAEQEDANYDTQLQAAATQDDRDFAAQMRFNRWDVILNQVWGLLKQSMEPEAMAKLTQLQLDWISQRDAAAGDATGQCADPAAAQEVQFTTSADWTKERVYYLLQYIPQ
ncbi:MAG: DUF1311 domain-containing protein [Oscillospiraceae bacterium]|nr:DUF1311 domain-containing protein [Oscillospiraceae bacterium]